MKFKMQTQDPLTGPSSYDTWVTVKASGLLVILSSLSILLWVFLLNPTSS